MSSTTLALSSAPASGAAPACSPLNRCTVATSSMISKKFLVFPSSSSSTAAARSTLNNDKTMIISQPPLGRCCYSTDSASIMMTGGGRRRSISCEVAVRSANSATSSLSTSSSTVTEDEEDEEQKRAEKKIGAKVRVKAPLKVYHVPRVPELDLTGKEGNLKQYVGLWKGKRISANYPYKIQFVVDIEGRGPVKFFSHLKEDEFEYLD
ncbi:ferredoxin-thioredoxin reductase subunit A2, chloroplastic-like [Euphorbia lathyris]|uniref:ferredoxin-thioredoxin reductase subunit A2, chloroplastic-like n=1 Tax=Euphorbia lathyris TaxID=212925 RepID=UPI003313DFC2